MLFIIASTQVLFDNQSESFSFEPEQFQPKELVFSIGDITAGVYPDANKTSPFTATTVTICINISCVDIDIVLVEEYSVSLSRDAVGVVVLPLTRFLGTTQPALPKAEWFQFFPYREAVGMSEEDNEQGSDVRSPVIFRSGDAAIPGSAMNKHKQSLGFICVQVEIFLIEPAFKLYLKSFHPFSQWMDQPVCIVLVITCNSIYLFTCIL